MRHSEKNKCIATIVIILGIIAIFLITSLGIKVQYAGNTASTINITTSSNPVFIVTLVDIDTNYTHTFTSPVPFNSTRVTNDNATNFRVTIADSNGESCHIVRDEPANETIGQAVFNFNAKTCSYSFNIRSDWLFCVMVAIASSAIYLFIVAIGYELYTDNN